MKKIGTLPSANYGGETETVSIEFRNPKKPNTCSLSIPFMKRKGEEVSLVALIEHCVENKLFEGFENDAYDIYVGDSQFPDHFVHQNLV